MTAPSFGTGKIIATILFERTMDGLVAGEAVPSFLRALDIVPFLKIDHGLSEQVDGAQLMRPISNLQGTLARARTQGMFGTKMRSLIHAASKIGIVNAVEQQFSYAREILDAGLVPIIEPEVSLKSPERAQCDALLTAALARQLDALSEPDAVVLKLSLPVVPNLYAPLIAHPRVARVAALSGGYSRAEACRELAKNRGVIASFSRALLQDLRHDMSDAQFDHALGTAINQIWLASVAKEGAPPGA